MCREEATRLSSLKPDLDALGVRLAAVVHERTGVSGFKPYFAGDIYWDKKRHFYGPHERWASIGDLLRLDVISRGIDMYKKGVDGNLKGEGRLLGGCYVIGPGDQGILYQHQENSFGDTSNTTEVLEAVKKITSKL
ncbi:unnamed protein product [Owenia fusiformis]|uniref:Peroxiredoxin-like 2A n=1 Tax=Owenia fusiformis TaxID=6347 RepID=A0A8J1XYD0_OWEFU|nr:unnamed protein product [Owenia fusiformis]